MIWTGARRRRAIAFGWGLTVLLSGLLLHGFVLEGISHRLRETGFGLVGRLFPRQPPKDQPVMVVDIDRATLAIMGPWPWPRERLAHLVEKIAAARPAVLGLDILLGEPGEESAAQRLATALRSTPTVLAAVLDPETATSTEITSLPLLFAGDARDIAMPQAPGLVLPPPLFLSAARGGIGLVSFLSGDEDTGQVVLSVPLAAMAEGKVLPGMATALLQTKFDAASLIIDNQRGRIRLGPLSIPLDDRLSLRLHHGPSDARRSRTVSAAALLGAESTAILKDKIVILGASAPEIGGLRPTVADPLMPSVQILADAAEQIIQGHAPVRPPHVRPIEMIAAALIAILGSLAVLGIGPLPAAAIAAFLSAAWILASVMAFSQQALLVDPLGPLLLGLVPVQVTALVLFSATLRERRAIERRFAQHLPAEVVARIADDPSRIRIDGEEREITALFTDIEGFTAMTERASAKDLIALLDTYVETTAGIVVAHGGMVDKVVGDAIHAFFNAPMDCADHPLKALTCARALIAATETLRGTDLGAKLGLGRTRIGIETGPAILGDVGGGRKLDYTAHGPAINAAAKLEAANKTFGTTILIGPGAASRLIGERLQAVGEWQASASSKAAQIYTIDH